MIEVVAVAVASLGIAAFRFFTAREFLKRANKKDIPAIAKAMYPRSHLGPIGRPRASADRARDELPSAEPDQGA